MKNHFVDQQGTEYDLWPNVFDALGVFAPVYREGNPWAGWIYRGQANGDWELIPSLYRPPCNEKIVEARKRYTDKFIASLKQYASDLNLRGLSDIQLKAVAQHYGFYTNLLDFTFDPDIAAFFATWNVPNDSGVGVIFCIQQEEYLELQNPFTAHGFPQSKWDEITVKHGEQPLPPIRIVNVPRTVRRVHLQKGVFIEMPQGNKSVTQNFFDRFYFHQKRGFTYFGGRYKNFADHPINNSRYDDVRDTPGFKEKLEGAYALGYFDKTPTFKESDLFPNDEIADYVNKWKCKNPGPD